MSLAILANLLTILFCTAVLVQSIRMMRSLRAMKDSGLTDVVTALDRATAQARGVLSEMKLTLGTECAQHARQVSRAEDLRDELSDMIGIADAACERIVSAMGSAKGIRMAGPEASDEAMIDDDADVLIDDSVAFELRDAA